MKTWIFVTMWITSDSGLLVLEKRTVSHFDHAHEATSYEEGLLSSFSNSWMLYWWKYWVAYFLLVQFKIVLTPLFFLCSVSLHLTLLSNTLFHEYFLNAFASCLSLFLSQEFSTLLVEIIIFKWWPYLIFIFFWFFLNLKHWFSSPIQMDFSALCLL